MAKTTEKSRKEKRKEARSTKKQTRHVSHINYQKTKRSVVDLKRAKFVKKSPLVAEKSSSIMEGPESPINEIPEKGVSQDFAGSGKEDTVEEQPFSSDVPKLKHKPSKNLVSKELINMEKKNSKRKKTKFEQLIEMENKGGLVSAEEDLRIERKLAKKLKVKQGKLRGEEDEMNSLFDDMPSVLGSLGDEQVPDDEEKKSDRSSSKKPKKRKRLVLNEERIEDKPSDNITSTGPETVISGTAVVKVEETCINVPAQGGNVKYIPPRLRDHARNESGDYTETCRLIRGLLNKLSDSNVEHVTMEICDKFKEVGRSIGTEILSKQVVSSVTEQHAAVFAAFVAGMACSVGIDFGAKLIVSLATCFEGEYRKEDNLSLRKLTLMLSYLCIFGVCASDLIYDFLAVLSKRLTEVDVSTILTILKCCGMKLRSDDPAAMKDFILSVQNRVNELKSTSGDALDNKLKINNKRMKFMLETILDIKNNKKKSTDDSAKHTQIKKWLQKLGVDQILLRGLKWNKLLDPSKKDHWWLSEDTAPTTDDVEVFATKIDREVTEAQKLLQLATTQRMNTDIRRAIFCIIMSGEDYLDSFEKLRSLDLPGKQDREIIRVLLDCCLQEKVFNKYYTILASKLCSHDKSQKITLKYCLWDRFKEIESMELIKSKNLARFISEMLVSFSLSLAVLKTVGLSNLKELTPKKIMHFRMLFEDIFKNTDAVVWNIFTRVAVDPDLEILRDGLVFFIKQYVVNTNDKTISEKFKIAKEALKNMEEILR